MARTTATRRSAWRTAVCALGLVHLLGCKRDEPPPAVGPPTSEARADGSEAEPPEAVTPAIDEAELQRFWQAPSPKTQATSRYVWWEAERAPRHNFPEHHPFEPEDAHQAAVLSGGEWIGAADAGRTLFLEYDVDVPQAGSYQFLARKFWAHGAFRWRFDRDPWQDCGEETRLLDAAPLRLHVEANWVEAGTVELTSGKHTLRIETLKHDGPVAFDAFVLSRGAFVPRGKLKPDEAPAAPPPGWVSFDPDPDDFEATPIDLRHLNQPTAGRDGHVIARGDQFVFEATGTPVRFWGVTAGHDALALTDAGMQRFARRLAKLGVNLVRLHGAIFDEDDFRRPATDKITRIHQLLDALRAEGVYLALSGYFPLWIGLSPDDGIEGYWEGHPYSLAYFSDDFQAVQRGWWKELLTSRNPRTGVPLARDPALAMVELVNEDSMFFWTFQPYGGLPAAQTQLLERRFGDWLSKKYGSVAKALSTWGGKRVRGDDAKAGRAGFLTVWELATQRTQRARDSDEFLARTMRDYYARMHDYLKGELGLRSTTVCSNWQTADERVLGPLDDWANAVCDVMDRHGYFSGEHAGDAAEYATRAGHTYENRSGLKLNMEQQPEGLEHLRGLQLPFVAPIINGKPSAVSELGWPWPNRFRAEGPMLTAVYGALQGLDAPMFAGSSEPHWVSRLNKFEVGEPATMGQFPAAALAFRRGLIRQGKTVARVELSESSMFALSGVPFAVEPALDGLRQKDIPRLPTGIGAPKPDQGVDPLALLAGPVELELGTGADRIVQQDLSPWLDHRAAIARSSTGEIEWHHRAGLVLVRAPGVEAALGFLGEAGPITLPHLSLEMGNDYAMVTLVALDERPIAESSRLLLQVMTEVKNSQWRTHGKGPITIDDPGSPPLLVRALDGQFALGLTDAQVTALDVNGKALRRRRPDVKKTPFLPGSYYYLIERTTQTPESSP